MRHSGVHELKSLLFSVQLLNFDVGGDVDDLDA
jgi:hypothetical protein